MGQTRTANGEASVIIMTYAPNPLTSRTNRTFQRTNPCNLDEDQCLESGEDSENYERSTMSPLKLTIPGRYWDTQIYRGRLYLFDREGSILTLDWDKLIENLPADNSLKLALVCAFKRSDYLYRVAATGIFHDREFKAILNSRFSTLAETPLVIEEKQRKEASLGQQENLFPFPHADSTIYSRRLYVSSQSGVFSASCNGQTKYPVSTRVQKLWDGSVLALEASHGSLALAAGEEGLWEYDLSTVGEGGSQDSLLSSPFSRRSDSETPLRSLAEQHCSECQWAFYSIYGSSLNGPGVLAVRHRTREESDTPGQFERLISEKEIFPDSENPVGVYSWAAQDKICQAANGSIRVAKYQPWDQEAPIKRLGSLSLERHGEAIVSAKVALFGTVVELDSGLVVISSNGETFSIDSEPVSWRVFPRSRHYENHLHIIYDDRLEVLSFNHDYLLDQREKVSGISGWFGDNQKSFDSLGLH